MYIQLPSISRAFLLHLQHRHRCEARIEVNHTEIGCNGVDWIGPVVVNMVMNSHVCKRLEFFDQLSNC